MNVGIIGHGFVGLACETGFQNICDVRVYDKYKDTESLEDVVDNCRIIFLCLPTPMSEDGSCDTSIIEDAVKKINKIAKKRKTLVIKSTVPPGTTERFQDTYEKHSFFFNPEFLREKTFIQDFLEQDRIIIGRPTFAHSKDFLALFDFYEYFINWQKRPAKIKSLDATTAEMVKYTTNCFLATKVSYFNEIYQICEKIGVKYDKLIDAVLMDERIGKSHAQVPGHDGDFGYGGKCFPKDLRSLTSFAKSADVEPLMLWAAWNKNVEIRKNKDWLEIPGATYAKGFDKK